MGLPPLQQMQFGGSIYLSDYHTDKSTDMITKTTAVQLCLTKARQLTFDKLTSMWVFRKRSQNTKCWVFETRIPNLLMNRKHLLTHYKDQISLSLVHPASTNGQGPQVEIKAVAHTNSLHHDKAAGGSMTQAVPGLLKVVHH
jgi:hypothetical protein